MNDIISDEYFKEIDNIINKHNVAKAHDYNERNLIVFIPRDILIYILSYNRIVKWYSMGLHLVCKYFHKIMEDENNGLWDIEYNYVFNKLNEEVSILRLCKSISFSNRGITIEKMVNTIKEKKLRCKWNYEEDNIVEKIFGSDHKGYFITGGAGTGKTHLVQRIKAMAAKKTVKLAVTASTGIAASNIAGETIHSWSNIGSGSRKDFLRALRNANDELRMKEAYASPSNAEMLIIDEISMLSAHSFDMVMQVLGYDSNNFTKKCKIIAIGDFYQLPPVFTKECKIPDQKKYAFESDMWKNIIGYNVIEIKTIKRQKDEIFSQLLSRMRIGMITKNDKEMLKKMVGKDLPNSDGIDPVQIYPTKRELVDINSSKFKEIIGTEYDFYSDLEITSIHTEHITTEELLKSAPYVGNILPVIPLKIGTQVILTCNLDTSIGLINGSKGVVDHFVDENGKKCISNLGKIKIYPNNSMEYFLQRLSGDDEYKPVIKFDNGLTCQVGYHSTTIIREIKKQIVEIKVVYMPLIYGWAITCHKRFVYN